MPTSKDQIAKVSKFKEKPDVVMAQKYIDDGGLWNGGVFAFKPKYVQKCAHELINFTDYKDLFQKYDTLT